jgi:pilus assembly protein CpaC
VINGLGSTNVEFKEYGVILDLQPIVGPDGGIFAKVETELSQLDPTQAVLGVPALLKRRSVTEINLRAGETLVIAGLTLRTAAMGTQGLPGLATRPRAGTLFGERTRREERTELAIFITAQVMQAQADAPPAAGQTLLEHAHKLADESAHD